MVYLIQFVSSPRCMVKPCVPLDMPSTVDVNWLVSGSTPHTPMRISAICAWVGPPRRMGKPVKFDGERRTIFTGGDDLANYSLICCARLSSNGLVTWIIESPQCACVLLPNFAFIEIETDVVLPHTKVVLYHLSLEVRATVVCILCKPANW